MRHWSWMVIRGNGMIGQRQREPPIFRGGVCFSRMSSNKPLSRTQRLKRSLSMSTRTAMTRVTDSLPTHIVTKHSTPTIMDLKVLFKINNSSCSALPTRTNERTHATPARGIPCHTFKCRGIKPHRLHFPFLRKAPARASENCEMHAGKGC